MRIIDADQYAVEMKMRQDAVQASVEHPIADRYYTDKEHWEGVMLAFVEAKLTLDKMPTVDAVPVKHGKWNHIGTLERYVGMSVETCSEFRCSVCDSPQTFFVPIAHYNYCPNCGAKMDIGAEND